MYQYVVTGEGSLRMVYAQTYKTYTWVFSNKWKIETLL